MLRGRSIFHLFLCPYIYRSGSYSVFGLSVRLTVCLCFSGWLQKKKLNIGHNFLMVCIRAFIFHMCISCGETFSLVPGSRSSVKIKVKYQGHFFSQKNRNVGHSFRMVGDRASIFHMYSIFLVIRPFL